MDKSYLAHGQYEWGVGHYPEAAAKNVNGEFAMWSFHPKFVDSAHVDPETGDLVLTWNPDMRGDDKKKERKLMTNGFYQGQFKWEDYMGHPRLVEVK